MTTLTIDRTPVGFIGECECYDGTGGTFHAGTIPEVTDMYFEHLGRSHK